MRFAEVKAPVKYIKWQSIYEKERPFYCFIDIPKEVADQRTTNIVYEDRETLFHDIRGQESHFSLDEHGFTIRKHELQFNGWQDRERVEKEYLPEVEALIREHVDGADKIYFFDWRVR